MLRVCYVNNTEITWCPGLYCTVLYWSQTALGAFTPLCITLSGYGSCRNGDIVWSGHQACLQVLLSCRCCDSSCERCRFYLQQVISLSTAPLELYSTTVADFGYSGSLQVWMCDMINVKQECVGMEKLCSAGFPWITYNIDVVHIQRSEVSHPDCLSWIGLLKSSPC